MRSKGLTLGLLLALVAAIGIFAVAAAAQKPMSGSISLVGGPAADCEGGMEIWATGDGTLAHIGKVTIVSTNCTGRDNNKGPTGLWDGKATFETADGATIEATFEGSQKAPVGTIAEYTTTMTITGGTGRLKGATGAWTIAGTIDFSTGKLVGDVSGWLRT